MGKKPGKVEMPEPPAVTEKPDAKIVFTADHVAKLKEHIYPILQKTMCAVVSVHDHVLVKMTSEGIDFVCTDGSRLVIVRAPHAVTEPPQELSFLLDEISMSLIIAKATAWFKTNTYMTIHLTEDHKRMRIEGWHDDGAIDASQYPRYEELMPAKFNHQVTFERHKQSVSRYKLAGQTRLWRALKECTSITRVDPSEREHEYKPVFYMSFKNNKDTADVELKGHPRLTWKDYQEVLNCSIAAEEITIGFDPKLLMDAINHKTTVVMRFSAPNKPAVFTYNFDDSVKHMLMPIGKQ